MKVSQLKKKLIMINDPEMDKMSKGTLKIQSRKLMIFNNDFQDSRKLKKMLLSFKKKERNLVSTNQINRKYINLRKTTTKSKFQKNIKHAKENIFLKKIST